MSNSYVIKCRDKSKQRQGKSKTQPESKCQVLKIFCVSVGFISKVFNIRISYWRVIIATLPVEAEKCSLNIFKKEMYFTKFNFYIAV